MGIFEKQAQAKYVVSRSIYQCNKGSSKLVMNKNNSLISELQAIYSHLRTFFRQYIPIY